MTRRDETSFEDRDPADPHGPWEDLVIETLDGRADPTRTAELEGHLTACPRCRAAAVEYRAIFAGLRRTAQADPPPEFWEALAAGIDYGVAVVGSVAPAAAPSRWSSVAGGLIAAGIAIALLVGSYLELPRAGGEPESFARYAAREDGASRGADVAAGEPARSGDVSPAPEGATAAAALETGEAQTALGAGSDLEADAEAEAATERDPLADLADVEGALRGLSVSEIEELLRVLEAQT